MSDKTDPTGKSTGVNASNRFEDLSEGAKRTARNKSLKITIVYFIAGCCWILISDNWEGLLFEGHASMITLSIAKGLFYVLLTSILIYGLVYPAFKKVLLAKDALNKANIELNKDISERKTREAKIEYLNYHDVLTGAYNRTYFQEEQKRLDRPEYHPLSIIIGDINGLKLINDAFGHSEGDALLIQTSEILKQCCREKDIVARTGGDEFSILLPNADIEVAKTISDCIRTIYEKKRCDKTIHTDIALGYATKNKPEDSFSDIIILAEDLMYRRKLLERQSLHSSILASIRTTMFEKSNETEEHAERLAQLSKSLGKSIELAESKMDELELVATLHDIGKISIDQNILTKTEKLSEEDWREIQRHPEVGFRIANSCQELRHIAEYILCHHERWDGRGYPQGISGENIPLISRIIAITDAYDAMTQDRAYRKAMSPQSALDEIAKNAGTQFDPHLAKAFIENVMNEENV